MLKKIVILASVVLAGCTNPGAVSGDPTPAVGPGSDAVNYWRQKAATDRAACRSAMMQARSSGVSPIVAGQQFTECNKKVNDDASQAATLDRQRTSPIADQILQLDVAARTATQRGRTDDAIGYYRQIDANGPAIIAEVQRLAPGGLSVSYQNSLSDNLHRMDTQTLLQELATAQRMIGLSYEHAAWGRGVPQDRARALELLGGSGQPTFWNGLLGGEQKGESDLAYLLRMNEIPRHPEEVNAAYISKIRERDMGAHLEALETLMETVNANQERAGVRSRPSPGFGCVGAMGSMTAGRYGAG
jgi:hypothetical protein